MFKKRPRYAKKYAEEYAGDFTQDEVWIASDALKRLIAKGESETLEFKRSASSNAHWRLSAPF